MGPESSRDQFGLISFAMLELYQSELVCTLPSIRPYFPLTQNRDNDPIILSPSCIIQLIKKNQDFMS